MPLSVALGIRGRTHFHGNLRHQTGWGPNFEPIVIKGFLGMITRKIRLLISTLAVMGLASAAWADAEDIGGDATKSSEHQIILAQNDTSNGNATMAVVIRQG